MHRAQHPSVSFHLVLAITKICLLDHLTFKTVSFSEPQSKSGIGSEAKSKQGPPLDPGLRYGDNSLPKYTYTDILLVT